MMPYLTIVRSWNYGSFPSPDPWGETYWVNRLAHVHQVKMNQARPHEEAIVDVSREYLQARGGGAIV